MLSYYRLDRHDWVIRKEGRGTVREDTKKTPAGLPVKREKKQAKREQHNRETTATT